MPGTNAVVQWARLGQLLKAAIQGIRDAAAGDMPKIVIHIDRGADWKRTKWFFDNLNAQGVPYDIIGESYYPFFHGPLTNVAICLDNAARRFGRPIFIAETGFPWIYSPSIYGIPATTNGQVQFLVTLGQIVKGVPNHLGAGIFWWGAEYQILDANEAGVGTRSLFDDHGNLLPAADVLGQFTTSMALNSRLSGPDRQREARQSKSHN